MQSPPKALLLSSFPRPHPPRTLTRSLRFGFPFTPLSTTAVTPGLVCQGEAGITYRLIRPLGTQIKGKPANVWLAVDDYNAGRACRREYVVKRPPEDDTSTAFKHELDMQRLFAKDPMIRKLVDYVPDSEAGGPMMVLEAFTDSLWGARNARPFTMKEIKWIMKGVLLGIYTVHMKGLVYTDLKMENIVLRGFDCSKPNENVRDSIVRLADCGTISKPGNREITPLTYRSPEVHFGKPWKQSTDVWSWAIILAQLLQAQVDFQSPGMYDSISTGSLEANTKAIRNQLATDFDLASIPCYAEDEQCTKLLPQPQPEEAYTWANSMVEKGVAGEDIQFLVEVLHPVPDARLTVPEILGSGYLEVRELSTQREEGEAL